MRKELRGKNYVQQPRDFRCVPARAPFFSLPGLLPENPRIPLDRAPSRHRWGFFYVILKEKEFLRITSGECKDWASMKVRPIGSTAPNRYGRWYSAAGKACYTMAHDLYPQGSSILSPQEIQAKVETYNAKLRDNPPQRSRRTLWSKTKDMENCYPNLKRRDLATVIKRSVRKCRQKGLLFFLGKN